MPPRRMPKSKETRLRPSSPAYKLMMNAISARNQNAVDERAKNFLTEAEMSSFLKVACKSRHGVRNFAKMLLAYRRASERTL